MRAAQSPDGERCAPTETIASWVVAQAATMKMTISRKFAVLGMLLARPTNESQFWSEDRQGSGCRDPNNLGCPYRVFSQTEIKGSVPFPFFSSKPLSAVSGLNRPRFCRHVGAMENGLIGGVYEQQAIYG